MAGKIRILHLWNNEEDARLLVQELARSGLEFEAKLVRTEREYVSALVQGGFQLIIADRLADFPRTGPDELSALDMARELAPDIPFLLVHDPPCADDDGAGGPDLKIGRNDFERLGPTIRTALRT